jgi:hypothetical protein
MSDSGQKFRTFEDLEVYQAAREFRRNMYAVARKQDTLSSVHEPDISYTATPDDRFIPDDPFADSPL